MYERLPSADRRHSDLQRDRLRSGLPEQPPAELQRSLHCRKCGLQRHLSHRSEDLPRQQHLHQRFRVLFSLGLHRHGIAPGAHVYEQCLWLRL